MRTRTDQVFLAVVIMLLGAGLAPRTEAQTIYVATNGTHDVGNSFNSWAGASTNIHEAVDLANTLSRNVSVSNGVYPLTNQLVIRAGFTLQSLNGVSNTFLRANGSTGGYRVMVISNGNAVVDGFTLTNGYSTGTHGGGIYMTTGTVRNCVIWGCGSPGGGSYSGGGVRMYGGVLTGSTIRACTSGDSAGLHASGGSTVEDCTIRDNVCSYTHSSYLTAPATIRNCRIFGNRSSYHSGGISIDGGATISGCISYSNVLNQGNDGSAENGVGGGISLWNGTAINCVMYGNDSKNGGGIGIIYGGRIVNCTVANNTARGSGGGLYIRNGNVGTVTNTIVYGNLRLGIVDNFSGTLSAAAHSCATELTNSSAKNITANPEFVNATANDYRLQFYSPCVDAGTNLASVATDYVGAPRPMVGNGYGQLRHDMGAYELNGTNSALQVWFSGSPVSGMDPLQSVLTATVAGSNTTITWYGWDLTNSGTFNLTGAGLGVVTNTYGPGIYSLRLAVSNSAGESAEVVRSNLISVASSNIYVWAGAASQFPYSSWSTAATNIHDAMSAALGPCTIWVTNGSYAVTNQIALSVAATLRSVNGTNVAALYRPTAYTNRLLYLSHASAVVQGLTLSNGLSSTFGGGIYMTAGTVQDCVITNCRTLGIGTLGNGGGVYMENGLMTNVLVIGCTPAGANYPYGGGLYMNGGKLANSTIRGCVGGNGAGIAAYGGTVEDCVIRDNPGNYVSGNIGAGATFRRCRFFNNSCSYDGGGIALSSGLMENCLVYSNREAVRYGGGIYMTGGTVHHCTVVSNDIALSSAGGGIYQTAGTIRNTIIHGNTRGAAANNYVGTGGTIAYSCAAELAPGSGGNINVDPKLKDMGVNDYSLLLNSPCIDAGTNLPSVTSDFDLAVRPVDGDGLGGATSDMGAYEAPDINTGPLRVLFTGTPRTGLDSVDVVFTAAAGGSNRVVSAYEWDFNADGYPEETGAQFNVITQNFTVGRHTIILRVSNSSGESASVTNTDYVAVASSDIFVSTNGTPQFPYNTWEKAVTNVHDAVGIAVGGVTIHLSGGTHLARYQVVLSEAIRMVGQGVAETRLARDASASSFGVMRLAHSNAVLEGMTIANGVSTTLGGGVHLVAGTVRDCLFTNCVVSGGTGGGGIAMESGLITNTVFANCTSGNGGGLWMTGGWVANCTFRGCTVSGGSGSGAGFYATGGTIEDCLITNCASGYIYGNYASGTTIRRCRFVGNTAGYWGGGIRMDGGLLENCFVYSNTLTATSPIGSAQGGGIYNSGGRVVNCTVVANRATGDGGGIYNNGGFVTNCVSWFNRSRYFYDVNGVTNDYDGSYGNIFFSCGTNLTAGVQSNVTAYPKFKSMEQGNFRLDFGSPCVNAGYTFDWMSTAKDLDGQPRIRQKVVEMGAYELAPALGTILELR